MKIMINEKQTKLLIKKYTDISEESSTEGGSEGQPEVGKWESGVSRGPSNQIGVTKWSEVVGSTLTRGKANKLK